jgi:hypothetical protein
MPNANPYTVTVEPCWGTLVLGHDPSCHTVTTLGSTGRILTSGHHDCEAHALLYAIELRDRYERARNLPPDQPCPTCKTLGYECPGPRYCGCNDCEEMHALAHAARFQSANTDR